MITSQYKMARGYRPGLKGLMVSLAVLLGGCAATAPQYYSLLAPAIAAAPQTRALQSDYVISVQPVLVPEQVARPQIVVASASGAEVVPLNAALWAGPLEAQVRDALSDSLTQRLNVLDIGLSKSTDAPVWKIFVDVQRFDSLYGDSIRQDIVWRLVPEGVGKVEGKRLCSAQLQLPVAAGMSALVEGHRRSLDILAGLIAQTLPATASVTANEQSRQSQPEGLKFRGCVG